jgi:hypothetical protein
MQHRTLLRGLLSVGAAAAIVHCGDSSSTFDDGGAGTQNAGGSLGVGGSLQTRDGSAGSGGGRAGDGGLCADIALKLSPSTPTVVLVIDRSDSMVESRFPGTSGSDPTRWDALKTALLDGTRGIIKQLEGSVRFGMVLYGNESPYEAPSCPDLMEIMPPRLNAYAAIDTVYRPLGTIPNTPTGESIQTVTTGLGRFTEEGPKYILLATDGDPDRCGAPDDHGDAAKLLSVNAVKAAWQAQIGTFVIAVGNEASEPHLNELAHWGRGINPATSSATLFFQPATANRLAEDFLNIINGVRDCKFKLNGRVDPALASQGGVTLDGKPVSPGAANGWTVNAAGNELTFHGTSCTTIKTGTHDLRASFPCGAVIEPPK